MAPKGWGGFALATALPRTPTENPLPPPNTHQDGVRGVDGDLVVGGVAVGQPQVVVLDVQVQVGQDELRARVCVCV